MLPSDDNGFEGFFKRAKAKIPELDRDQFERMLRDARANPPSETERLNILKFFVRNIEWYKTSMEAALDSPVWAGIPNAAEARDAAIRECTEQLIEAKTTLANFERERRGIAGV